MAHKKGGGATKKNRDSAGKRLGVKLFGSQIAEPGNIIVRQKGTKFNAGSGTMIGKDFSIFAIRQGTVKFREKLGKKFVEVV